MRTYKEIVKNYILIYKKMAKEGDILSTTEQTHQQDLERLKALRYMDDDFMTVCLADNFEGVELILRKLQRAQFFQVRRI